MRDEEDRHRQREKESKRSAHSKKEKSRDKERKRGQEEKVRSRAPGGPYVEDDSEDDYRPPPRSSEKKSNRHRMEEEIRMREEEARAERERAATAEVPRIREIPLGGNWDVHKEKAARYMQASRKKAIGGDDFVNPGLRRAETFAPAGATYNVRYATPPAQYSDDEAPRRSSARPKVETRRSSDTPKRDKSSRRSPVVDPYIVSPPSPPPTRRPSLQTYSSAPPAAEEFVRAKPVPSRSKTQDYPRHEIPPPLPRAATFQSGDRGRDRGASKLRKEVTSDSESDAPIHASPRQSHSPPPRRTQHRYVYENGATIPVPPSSRHRADLHDLNDSYPRERSVSPHGTSARPPLTRNLGSGGIPTRSHSGHYYTSPEPIVHTVRPKMSPRTDSHRTSSRQIPPYFNDVKYSQGFDNVSYSANPADMYASHHRRGSDDRGYHYPRGGGREPIYTI